MTPRNSCQDEAGRAISTLWRWREEWIAFHRTGGWTNAVAESVNAKIEVLELERKAYGFKNKVNHQARILLECSGHHRVSRAA
ncbi:MAG: transposase [Acidimicrobiales bacterium]